MVQPTRDGSAVRAGGTALLLLLGAAGVLHALSYYGCGPLDDDFIVYRYARNLVEGRGLVFNLGERVEGFSCPLWVLVIAGGLAAGFEPVATSLATSVGGLLLAVLAAGLAWRRLAPGTTWYPPAALLAASPAFAWHAVAGLGTVAMAGLTAAWLWLWLAAVQKEERPLGAAVALGLAGLLRAEAVLLALPFVVCERGRGHSRTALLSLAPALGWLAFRLVYYGGLLPNTYAVKKLPVPDDLSYGLLYLLRGTLTTGIGVLAVLALPLLWRARTPLERALAAATVGVLGHVAYVVWVGGDFLRFSRFFLPVLPVALVVGCAGLRRVAGARPRLLTAVFALALIVSQWPQLTDSRAELRRRQREFEVHWTRLAQVIAGDSEPGTRVATSAIGLFGWASDLELIDMLGLTNAVLRERAPDLRIAAKGHHRHDAAWVLEQAPEFVVPAYAWQEDAAGGEPTLVVSAWEGDLWLHPEFARRYQLVAVDVEGQRPLFFHVRNGTKVPRGARAVAHGENMGAR